MKFARLVLVSVFVFTILGVVGCQCGGSPPPATTGEPQPSLYVFAAANKDVVHTGETFYVAVTLENRGVGKAENVELYFEPSAQGYALAEDCHYTNGSSGSCKEAMEALAPFGMKVTVGDVFPNDEVYVTIEFKATDKGASEPENVDWTISHKYYGGAKVQDTTLRISFSTGGMPMAPPP